MIIYMGFWSRSKEPDNSAEMERNLGHQAMVQLMIDTFESIHQTHSLEYAIEKINMMQKFLPIMKTLTDDQAEAYGFKDWRIGYQGMIRMFEQKADMLYATLIRSVWFESEEAKKLKTQRGRLARLDRYYDKIITYPELDESCLKMAKQLYDENRKKIEDMEE